MLLSTLCFQARRTALKRHEPSAFPLRYSIRATSLACRIYRRPYCRRTFSQAAPHTIMGQWPTRRFVIVGRKKENPPSKLHQPRIGARKALCWDHRGDHGEAMKIHLLFSKLPFGKNSECACCNGLHYATCAAPPDPLLHHQKHNRLWHVSVEAQG